MRRALAPRPATQNVSTSQSLPAPVGGWNTRDSLAAMPVTDAISMDNWYPETTDVRPRPGSDVYAQSGLSGQCETLISYESGTTLRLYVAVDGTFQNISTVGTTGTVANGTAGTGYLNDRWQYRNFSTPGGHFVVAVNGQDTRQIFAGTSAFAGSVTTLTTIDSFTNIEIFNRRIFYAEKNTLRFIYHVNSDAIGGTVSAFDLGPLLDMGGYLTEIGTWTRDGGSGMEDNIVFLSNRGQLAVYQGTDPSSANTWGMIGVYRLPPPVSNRAIQKFGGEMVIATVAGVVPLSSILSGLVQQPPLTDKIRTSIADAVMQYGSRFGWQLKYVPQYNYLLVNVPVAEGASQQQYVMNSQTMSWCRWMNLQANVWEVHNNKLYIGGNQVVSEVSPQFLSDNSNDIAVDVRQAATPLGLPGYLKLFRMFRPLINSDGDLPFAADINVDFANQIPTNIPTAVPSDAAVWDLATWDVSSWADSPTPTLFWQSCGRLGTYGSVRIKGSINTLSVRWYGTDIVFEPGGMI